MDGPEPPGRLQLVYWPAIHQDVRHHVHMVRMQPIFAMFILVALLASGCIGDSPSQLYWDSKIKDMCKQDGGARVFERVVLGKKQMATLFNQFGKLSPPLETDTKRTAPIVLRYTTTYIRRGDPEVRRVEMALVRKSDGKVLGTLVTYHRVGGDIFALHPSYYSCPERVPNLVALVLHEQ